MTIKDIIDDIIITIGTLCALAFYLLCCIIVAIISALPIVFVIGITLLFLKLLGVI